LIEVKTFVQRDMDVSPLGFDVGVTPMDEHFPGEIHLESYFPHLAQGVCGTGIVLKQDNPK
jgi:adenosylhomocysteine nucleosidase